MNNWQYHDSKMLELKKIYNKVSKQTQNKLQEIFDTFKFSFDTLYNIADNKTKARVNTYIEEWKDKGLLTGYFGMLANNIYKRTRVKNSEILELLIYGAYIEEQSKLDKYEKQIMYDDTNYYYQQGQQEVINTKKKKKPLSIMDMALFLYLLNQPNYTGTNLNQCIQATIQYNIQQLYRQALINIQEQKELQIENNEFQKIINQQQNTKLCVNDDKISGFMDMQMIGLNNRAKAEGISSIDNGAKVIFLGNIDGKETEMCHSLHRQEFYINKWNEFNRYFGETAKDLKIQKIRCKGLVLGLNLPPISHHFHWCRSIIQYIPSQILDEDDEEFIDTLKSIVTGVRKVDVNKIELINKAFKNKIIRNIITDDTIKEIYRYRGKKCKHSEGNIYLNKDWFDKTEERQMRTIRHEIGHAVDYKNGYISKGRLLKALQKDKIDILNKKDIINSELKGKYSEYLELSDIIGSITNNKVVGFGYHNEDYWKRRGKIEKETFANLFSIAGSNNLKYLEVIDKYLQNTLQEFDKIIKELK